MGHSDVTATAVIPYLWVEKNTPVGRVGKGMQRTLSERERRSDRVVRKFFLVSYKPAIASTALSPALATHSSPGLNAVSPDGAT